MATFQCEHCGLSIEAPQHLLPRNQRFCSRACVAAYALAQRPIRLCGQCGTVLTAKQRVFCSVKCQRTARILPRVPFVCQHCGRTLMLPPAQARKRIFCSPYCRSQAHRGFEPGGEGYVTTCLYCRKSFYTMASKHASFCTKAHYDAWRRQKWTVERVCSICGKVYIGLHGDMKKKAFCSALCGYASRRKRVTRRCLECGVSFEFRRSTLKRGGRVFCSPKCSQRWHTGRPSGSLAPRSGIEASQYENP